VKKVVYTAIIGKYDVLNEPKVVSEGFDYVCFTDNITLKSPIWEIVLVSNPQGLDNTRQARKIKILCNSVLKEYDLSIWIDGNITINCDLNIFLDENYHGKDIVVLTHPDRSCVYEEAKACIAFDKDDPEIINKQMEGYKSEEYPAANGMVSTGLMIRNHRSKKVKEFMNSWWNEVYSKSKRDQLSFNYVLWKHQLSVGHCDYKKTYSSDFELYSSHPKSYVSQLQADIEKKNNKILSIKEELTQSKNHISKLEQEIQNKESNLANLESEIGNIQNVLEKIYQSFTWKTLRKFDRFIGKT